MTLKNAILSLLPLLFLGCTDATQARYGAYGDPAWVECYSGDRLVYSGFSSGKVISEQGSDGYFFQDKKTGKAIEVSGTCVFYYNGGPNSSRAEERPAPVESAPVAQPCGNGVLEAGEQCDSANLDGNTCGTLGFTSGNLGCSATCTLDTAGCVEAEALPAEEN